MEHWGKIFDNQINGNTKIYYLILSTNEQVDIELGSSLTVRAMTRSCQESKTITNSIFTSMSSFMIIFFSMYSPTTAYLWKFCTNVGTILYKKPLWVVYWNISYHSEMSRFYLMTNYLIKMAQLICIEEICIFGNWNVKHQK